MGFDVQMYIRPGTGDTIASIAALCDHCRIPVSGDADVLYADTGGKFNGPNKLYLACTPDCAESVKAHIGQVYVRLGTPLRWTTFSIASYWLGIGLQLELIPSEVRDSVVERLHGDSWVIKN
ncbi:MAG: hypothetical protein M3440_02190 [Chloroflexota bacterium]|nr:hypothetical protein [Chloroflexota bacterium]